MSAILVRIRSLYPDLQQAEKRVADYILGNAKDVPFQSVYTVADTVNVSVASVSRFVRKIGFSSYKNFKVELAKDSSVIARDMFSAIEPEDTGEQIIKKVFQGNIKSLEDTLKLLETRKLIEVAKILEETKRIIFFGLGISGNVAWQAALRFSHIDLQAEVYTDPIYMTISANRMNSGGAAVGISHSGRTEVTIEALKVAKSKGAVTVGITNYLESPLAGISDYVLCTSFSENKVKSASLSSHIAQLCIIDALYLVIASKKKETPFIDDINILTDKLFRIE